MPQVREYGHDDAVAWDSYVEAHPQASVFHLSSFRTIIEKTYRHSSHYLIAYDHGVVRGVLPLFFMASPFMGRSLVSLPFFDYGGIIANDRETAAALLQEAVALSRRLRCGTLELRQTYRLDSLGPESAETAPIVAGLSTNTRKVAMRMRLPDSANALFSSFSDKLRSQVRRSRKEGCVVESGGAEMLDDFYDVFVHNMRDLGSPVHSPAMMHNVLEHYRERSRVFVVYLQGYPIACSLAVGFRDVLVNPWASARRTHRRIAPNMLLYWAMLEYAIESGYRRLDFGRSTRDEGTFRFKAQWGAAPEDLFWYYHSERGKDAPTVDENQKELFTKVWRRLPLPITRLCGPVIRRHISL